MRAYLAVIALAALLGACAGPMVRPAVAPVAPRREALLVLPGFGYGRAEGKAFRSLAPAAAAEGIDLYVAPFVTRSGLESSRDKLARFIRDNRLQRYERVHVFAFIAGAWTFNPLVDRGVLPNLATVVYDRSPFQERAPRIAVSKLPLLAWARYGSTIFDVAKTPYAPLAVADVKVAIVVESKPTPFIRRYDAEARKYGPFAFGCDGFHQRHDDCFYVPMNHDELYERFAEVWPELLTFARTGRFSVAADRNPPVDDATAQGGRR
jgi:hypothetical protein